MTANERVVIIGSGPAAVAAALALCKLGEVPLVLDVGLVIDDARAKARARLASTDPEHWSAADLQVIEDRPEPVRGRRSPGVIAAKRLFGSDFTFEDDGVAAFDRGDGVGIVPSYARGGMSNIWGGGLLVHSDRDTPGWPIGAAALEPHYREVLAAVPYAAAHDPLAERHPLLREPDGALTHTEAARAMLSRLTRHTSRLRRRGISFGGSRLAVRVEEPTPERGCVYCGRCLDGCPYGHIYSSAQTLAELVRVNQVRYRSAMHVTSLEVLGTGVAIHATRPDGRPEVVLADAVYLGAGALSSTRILQASGMLPRETPLLDSQAVYIPFLWFGRSGRRRRAAKRHTLSELFLVVEDPAVAASGVHLSLYTTSPGVESRARATYPRIARALGPLFNAVLASMVTGIAFIHSDRSHQMVSIANADGSTRIEALENPVTATAVHELMGRLRRHLGPLGLVPLGPLAKVAPVGGSYHLGGSIPMSDDARPGTSDLLGRPYGTAGIHVIDASCLPSLPGGPITLLIMANAHRIAAESRAVVT